MTARAVNAILRLEALSLLRSWLLRVWLVLAVLLSLLAIANADQGRILARTMVNWLAIYSLPSTIFFGVLGTGALGTDLDIAADAILSRAVTRFDYVAGKVGSRIVTVIAAHLAVILPTLFLMQKFGKGSVDSAQIVVVALGAGLVLVFLTALGSAIAGLLRNSVVAVAALMVFLASQSLVFDFLGLEYLSPSAVIRDSESWLNGTASAWEEARPFLAFGLGTLACLAAAFVSFDKRDL